MTKTTILAAAVLLCCTVPVFAQDGEAHGSRGNQEFIGVDLDNGGVYFNGRDSGVTASIARSRSSNRATGYIEPRRCAGAGAALPALRRFRDAEDPLAAAPRPVQPRPRAHRAVKNRYACKPFSPPRSGRLGRIPARHGAQVGHRSHAGRLLPAASKETTHDQGHGVAGLRRPVGLALLVQAAAIVLSGAARAAPETPAPGASALETQAFRRQRRLGRRRDRQPQLQADGAGRLRA